MADVLCDCLDSVVIIGETARCCRIVEDHPRANFKVRLWSAKAAKQNSASRQ